MVFHPLDQAADPRDREDPDRATWASAWPSAGSSSSISDGALALLGNIGFDPVYGARPLKRAIQQQLENPLANKILSGEFGAGDTVVVDTDGVTLNFRKPKRTS